MQGRFYSDVFRRAGVALVAPAPPEQDYVHETYMGELVNGIVCPETRARFLAIIDRLRTEEKIDGVILGGTELSLLFREVEDAGVPILDTTKLHVERIVAEILS